MFSRRSFMGGLAGLGALAGLGLPRLAAAKGVPTRLVVYFAYGGWDTTYLFDPKPGSSGVDTPSGDWVQHAGLELWDTGSMDATHRFFETWADRITVVNGITINSLVHEECARRILTGSSTASIGDIGARVADALGRDRPLPYLTIGANARTAGLEAQAGMVGWSNQLHSLTVPDFEWPSSQEPLRPNAAEDAAVRAYLEQRTLQLAEARGSAGSNQKRLDDYLESLSRAERMREAAPGSFLSDTGLFNDYGNAGRAAAALAEGFSQAVFVTDGGYWDTHSGNAGQDRLYNDLSDSLGEMLAALDEAGIADETLVLVVSEMGRSPLLNAQNGKDHWPYTSAMLIGANVRSAMVRGTDEQLHQVPVDLDTGEASSSGRALQPGDLLATVAELMELDAGALYPDSEVIRAALA